MGLARSSRVMADIIESAKRASTQPGGRRSDNYPCANSRDLWASTLRSVARAGAGAARRITGARAGAAGGVTGRPRNTAARRARRTRATAARHAARARAGASRLAGWSDLTRAAARAADLAGRTLDSVAAAGPTHLAGVVVEVRVPARTIHLARRRVEIVVAAGPAHLAGHGVVVVLREVRARRPGTRRDDRMADQGRAPGRVVIVAAPVVVAVRRVIRCRRVVVSIAVTPILGVRARLGVPLVVAQRTLQIRSVVRTSRRLPLNGAGRLHAKRIARALRPGIR